MNAWSFSSMNTFQTCPRQYKLNYIDKVIPYQETDATRWGNAVHKALEDYCRDGAPLSDRFAAYQPYADKILSLPGDKVYEQKLGISGSFGPTTFFDKSVWCRGIIDVLVVHGTKALVADWKTGKVKPDSDQLKLFAVFTFIHHPSVDVVKTCYVWLGNNKTTVETYTRAQLPELLRYFVAKASRLQAAYDNDRWVPRPSGLCNGWCGATAKHCEFWKPKRS